MEPARRSPGAAFLLSLVPGAGHVYAGRMGAGALWLVGAVMAYRVGLPFGLLAHFVCAVGAARAVLDANREEAAELGRRREKASEVAELLDAVAPPPAAAGALPAPAVPAAADPPPRVMRAAFPVPPAALLEALAGGMRDRGVLVLGHDRDHLRLRGSVDLGAGRSTVIAAQVEATPSGSRVRLLVDRPAGSAGGAEVDDGLLRGILESAERSLGAGGAAAPAAVGGGEALTEDHFLEQLREAWEAREQGWLPEEEWAARKASLVRSVVLRSGTRLSDFLAACRPLVEAEVLDPADLRALEASLGGRL